MSDQYKKIKVPSLYKFTLLTCGGMILVFLLAASLIAIFVDKPSVRIDDLLRNIWDVIKIGTGLFFGLLTSKVIDFAAAPLEGGSPGIQSPAAVPSEPILSPWSNNSNNSDS